jgi:hypothetical protein
MYANIAVICYTAEELFKIDDLPVYKKINTLLNDIANRPEVVKSAANAFTCISDYCKFLTGAFTAQGIPPISPEISKEISDYLDYISKFVNLPQPTDPRGQLAKGTLLYRASLLPLSIVTNWTVGKTYYHPSIMSTTYESHIVEGFGWTCDENLTDTQKDTHAICVMEIAHDPAHGRILDYSLCAESEYLFYRTFFKITDITTDNPPKFRGEVPSYTINLTPIRTIIDTASGAKRLPPTVNALVVDPAIASV